MKVLLKILDKAAAEGKIGYHPYCKDLQLTHLCFADDLLVCADGKQQLLESILQGFHRFEEISGLSISLEKSTLYTAGVTDIDREMIISNIPLASGSLLVRYLGLPLMTKRMTSADYAPLIERIRKKITSWTARQLSFAGRLQFVNTVIHSLTNFWMSVYRLPNKCTKEVDQICSAFLWPRPAMSSKKAKIAWSVVCKPKEEGCLGV